MGRLLLVAPGTALLAVALPSPALADEPPDGPLAIDIQTAGEGGPSLHEGDERTYAITIHNESDEEFPKRSSSSCSPVASATTRPGPLPPCRPTAA